MRDLLDRILIMWTKYFRNFKQLKRGIFSLSFLIFSPFFLSCEDIEKVDNTNPSVTITYPFNLSVVSEIVQISCAAADNDSLKKVVLWINGAETEIIDSIAPYILDWNTLSYPDSSSHSIAVVAHDLSGNIAISTPIQVVVDNRTAHPSPIAIESISYTDSEMIIKINQSTDLDFKGYIFLFSDMENGEKFSLSDTISSRKDTTLYLTDFNPSIPRWYWLKVIDNYGLSTIGEGFLVHDINPLPVNLHSVQYLDVNFLIKWTKTLDTDFKSYQVFESDYSDMSDSTLIFETIDSTDTTFVHENIMENRYKYYRVTVQDYWGLESNSNIKCGSSWVRFYKTYGNQNYDYGRSIVQAENGDYTVLGFTSILGNSANNLILKRISSIGEIIWEQEMNLSQTDKGYSLISTIDEDLIILGEKTSVVNGSSDISLIRTNSFGIIEWELEYGTDEDEIGRSIEQTVDGGFIISGQTVSPNTGFNFVYLLKINSQGVEEWEKSYGGEGDDIAYSVMQDVDGGYLIAGVTRSNGDFDGDGFLMKTDTDGNQIWYKTYGGNQTDIFYEVSSTNDDGFLLVGQTNSYGNGANDAYLVKVSSNGDTEWTKTFGSTGTDYAMSGSQSTDGGYFFTGYSDSYGGGGFDAWWGKIDQNGNFERDGVYGFGSDDRAYSGMQTIDGGYVMTGYSKSNNQNIPDLLIIKIDSRGNAFD